MLELLLDVLLELVVPRFERVQAATLTLVRVPPDFLKDHQQVKLKRPPKRSIRNAQEK